MMDQKKLVRVTLINGNFPPSQGPTGAYANELVQHLQASGRFAVSVITLTTGYNGIGGDLEGAGKVHRLKSFYAGKSKIPRLLNSLVSGYRMISKAKKLNADWTIVMTDPILLSMWAGLRLKRNKWLLWSMDLFPDALFSSHLLKEEGWIGQKLMRWTYGNPPQGLIALGPNQAKFLESRYNRHWGNSVFVLPAGIVELDQEVVAPLPDWKGSGKVVFGYCGNIGEAHDADFIIQVIQQLNADQHLFVLRAYGAKAAYLLAAAQAFPVVKVMGHIPQEHLKLIDIHLATLASGWTHVCVPSKVVSAVCAGSGFLLKADSDGDNWQLLQGAGVLFPNRNQLDGFDFNSIDLAWVEAKRAAALSVGDKLRIQKNKAFEAVSDFMR